MCVCGIYCEDQGIRATFSIKLIGMIQILLGKLGEEGYKLYNGEACSVNVNDFCLMISVKD